MSLRHKFDEIWKSSAFVCFVDLLVLFNGTIFGLSICMKYNDSIGGDTGLHHNSSVTEDAFGAFGFRFSAVIAKYV